ncbi:MAG: adenylate/guanylate cyclase domain-containing protein [Campylobacterales bacterium]|nr:adenylate/guanylate cyclase domain-containing protein [Campylobacterales bacterium]
MRLTYRLTQFFLFVVVSAAITYAYLFLPASYQSLDDRIRDFLFIARGTVPASQEVVIVDIDEKSLHEIGQWPWERSIIATMLQNLTAAKAGIIGLDMVFSEEDKTSPHRFSEQFHLHRSLPNYDTILAQTVHDTPTILGYIFNFDRSYKVSSSSVPNIPAIFIEKNIPPTQYLLEPKGILTNIPSLQNSSYSSGFINNVPDATGSIRSVPLIMRYGDALYPSLAFEMFRIALNAHKVTINYSPLGLVSLRTGDMEIPTDRNGRLYLNHRGPGKTFRYISASDIVNNTFDKRAVEGKFVLVGTSAYGLMDLRSNPFDNIIPGIEIQATVIDNLLNHDMLQHPQWSEVAEISLIIFLSFIVFYPLTRLSPLVLIVGYVILFWGLLYLNYYLLFTHHIIINLFFILVTLSVSILSVLGMNFVFEHRQKEQVKKKFAQKVSKQVMDDLLSSDIDDALSTREVEVTIFFSDIRSFTTISEQLGSPQKLVSFLNEYMTTMATSIIESHGTIDKFIGDAIMAYWNAPNHVEHHADRAVESALHQLSLRERLNDKFYTKFGVRLDFGIGLNSGIVTVGDIGSTGRSDYTVVGDAVNLASRLEGLCKHYHVRLIISEFTYQRLQSTYVIRELDTVRVKGKSLPIRIYEVIAIGTPTQEMQRQLNEFHRALQLYYGGKFTEAIEAFTLLKSSYAELLYDIYIERSRYLLSLNLEHFDGVYDFIEK